MRKNLLTENRKKRNDITLKYLAEEYFIIYLNFGHVLCCIFIDLLVSSLYSIAQAGSKVPRELESMLALYRSL